MSARTRPRKIAGWQFFNENVEVCDVVRPGGLVALEGDDKKVAKWFIQVLQGSRKVLDLGCGSGFPGLYVAPHVETLAGMDAAPNMIVAAQANATKLGVKNASFEVGGTKGIRFEDEEFDGAILCGLLESMDWETVDRMTFEVKRVLVPGGRIAIVDRDWQNILDKAPSSEAIIKIKKEHLILQFVERISSPPMERDFRYLIDSNSLLGQRFREELNDEVCVHTKINRDELEQQDFLDAWYDETAQFDAETLTELILSKGFRAVKVESLPVWGKTLFLTAIK